MSGSGRSIGNSKGAAHLALGFTAPLAMVAVAYGLWFLSDSLEYVGPLDRASFGWTVVVPVSALAPVAAAFAWRRLSPRVTAVAATTVGLTVGGVAAALLWSAVAFPSCEFGTIRTPIELVPPSVLVALVIGTGLSGAGLVSVALLRRGHPLWASAAGAGSGLAVLSVAGLAAATMLLGPACQRPPLS